MPTENPQLPFPPDATHEDWKRQALIAANEWDLNNEGVRILYDNHFARHLEDRGLGHLVVRSEDKTGGSLPDKDHPHQYEGSEVTDLHAKPESAEELRAAYRGWLERRGIQQDDTPHLTMTEREFTFLRNVGLDSSDEVTSFFADKTKKKYNIPPDTRYIWVDVKGDDPNSPHITKLVDIDKEDFGTVVEEGRPESQDIEAERIPHVTLTQRAFNGLTSIGVEGSDASSNVAYAKTLYDIPDEDQLPTRYALVDVVSDPDLPPTPKLVTVYEADFGTVIDRGAIAKDLQYLDSDPSNPLMPNSGGEGHKVDIREALRESGREIESLASDIMKVNAVDPFNGQHGDIGIRAGSPFEGQKDAYVWVGPTSFTNAVELTLLDPKKYDSVCVVSGQMRVAANNKAAMAQIDNPTEIFTIKGANLERLQRVYQKLYDQPDFALTEGQRKARDGLFNDQLKFLISYMAEKNEQQRIFNEQRSQTQPRQQARELPGS